MFCKIRKGKNTYSIYVCDRKRVDGKVVSNDSKIISLAWHSLYEIDEEYNGVTEDIPGVLYNLLTRKILKNNDLDIFEEVVQKLIKAKKEYYTTYRENSIKVHLEYEQDKKNRKEKELKEYETFKEKFRTLHYNEVMAKYKEGYDEGLLKGALAFANSKKVHSVESKEMNEQEIKLLKEAFKLLSHKHHPDKGGSTEKMAMINNLKEKIL